MEKFILPPLAYGYDDLAPAMSAEQLTIHHTKHHQAYVNGANAVLEKMEAARQGNVDLDLKAALKELSFHVGGFVLHSLFWENLAPVNRGGGGEPGAELAAMINDQFGGFERFKKEFEQAAGAVEGSGWAVLCHDPVAGRLLIAQIEKHNVNLYPNYKIILALDVWEHAFYLDYKNEKNKYIQNFWSIVNWSKVRERL